MIRWCAGDRGRRREAVEVSDSDSDEGTERVGGRRRGAAAEVVSSDEESEEEDEDAIAARRARARAKVSHHLI